MLVRDAAEDPFTQSTMSVTAGCDQICALVSNGMKEFGGHRAPRSPPHAVLDRRQQRSYSNSLAHRPVPQEAQPGARLTFPQFVNLLGLPLAPFASMRSSSAAFAGRRMKRKERAAEPRGSRRGPGLGLLRMARVPSGKQLWSDQLELRFTLAAPGIQSWNCVVQQRSCRRGERSRQDELGPAVGAQGSE
jgi:hypothetical protein